MLSLFVPLSLRVFHLMGGMAAIQWARLLVLHIPGLTSTFNFELRFLILFQLLETTLVRR